MLKTLFSLIFNKMIIFVQFVICCIMNETIKQLINYLINEEMQISWRWKKLTMRKNIKRIIFGVILIVLINIKLNNTYHFYSWTLNSWLCIKKETWKKTILQKNENENKNIKHSDSVQLFNIEDIPQWKMKIHGLQITEHISFGKE